MVELSIGYAGASEVVDDGAGALTVALATPMPAVGDRPVFFDAWVARPTLVAALLLCVGAVARARYFLPFSARLLDPILTSGDDRLRIEAFSSCCGVYARADLFGADLDEASIGTGTTNVDLGQEFRDALMRLDDTSAMRLSIGAAGVRVATRTAAVVERKVKLPTRWVTGLGEAALAQLGMEPLAELRPVAARGLLAALPPAGPPSTPGYTLTLGPGGPRFTGRRVVGAVCVAGPNRLRELRPLARFATALRVWARPGTGVRSCAWELTLPGARMWLVLSPDVTRGFSGEGGALEVLSDPAAVADAVALRPHLNWRARLDDAELARRIGTTPGRVSDLFAVLGSQGLVGRDLAEDAWFRRDLPFARELVPALAPRVRGAAAIGSTHVELRALPDGRFEAFVRSGQTEHRVVLDAGTAACTCAWYVRHTGSRGPCRHALAARARLREMR